MANDEVLRAMLYARSNIAGAMRRAASGIADVRDSTVEAAASAASLSSSMDAAEGETNQFANAANDAGDEALAARLKLGAMSEGVDGVRNAALTALPALLTASVAVDSVGDEALESTPGALALASSLNSVSVAASGAGLTIGGLEVSLTGLAAVAGAVVAVITALAVALTGVAVAAAGAAAAIAALLGGGLLMMGQQAADQQRDLKSALEGVQHVLGQIKEAAQQIFAPLANPQNAALFQGVVAAMLATLADFVTMTQRLQGALAPVAERLGAVFSQSEPEFFIQLEKLVRALLPYLEDIAAALLTAVPDALRWLRENAVTLMPQLMQLGDALGDLIPPLLELAAAAGGVLLPVLSAAIEVVAGAATVLADVFVPVLQVAGDALTWLVEVAEPLLNLIGKLIGVFQSFTYGGYVAVIVALASVFGILDDAVSLATDTFSDFKQMLKGVWSWLLGVIEKAEDTIAKLLGVKEARVEGAVDAAIRSGAVAAQGMTGLPVGAAATVATRDTVEKTAVSEATQRQDDSGEPRPSASRAYGSSGSGGSEQYFDFSGADFSGTDPARVKRVAKEAVREANQEQNEKQGGSTS